MGLRWLVALAVVVVFVTGAHADEIGGARFTLPDGWTARDQNGSRVVVPSSLEQGELMKGIVLGVQPITGTPEAKLDEVAAILNGDATVTSTSAVTTTDRGAAGRVHAKNYVVDSKDDGAHNRMIAVLVRGKYCAVVSFLISGEPALKRHGDGLQTILKSLAIAGAPPAPAPTAPAASPARTSSRIPTGDTPNLYPGSSGFLPSGRGVPVPAARVVNGRPEGIWWYPQVQGMKTVALRVIYLPDGTCATSPRPGAPMQFDLDGQRKLGGVGTFDVTAGRFKRTIDGHTQESEFSSGSDKEGPYMNLGAMRHRPLAPVETKFLVGTWKSAGNSYTFRADGTYSSGHVSDTFGVQKGGAWVAEGYLLFVRPEGEAGWVSTIGSTTNDYIVIDGTVYTRQ